MTEPNPYESSQTPIIDKPKPLTAKKAMGCLTLLFLTPLAVALTGFVSCISGMAVLGDTNNPNVFVPLFFAISFIPPIVVLVLMMVKGIAAYKRDRK